MNEIKSQRLVETYRKLKPFLNVHRGSAHSPSNGRVRWGRHNVLHTVEPTFAEFCDHYQMDPDTGERRLVCS